MKIIHLFFGFRTGGAESLVIDLANRQVERGHDVTLAILNDEADPQLLSLLDNRVRVVMTRRSPGSRNPLHLVRFNMAIWRLRPDIMHFHNINLPGAVLPGLRRRAVMTLHTNRLPVGKARGAELVAISDQVASEVAEEHPGMPVTTIYNAIDFQTVPVRDAERRHPACFRLVQLGRVFADIKGQDLLIEALALLKKRGVVNLSVDFIGDGADIQNLQVLASSRGVGDRVRFLGTLGRAETYRRLGEYDLMVHPSRVEGFGLALIEGMAAGLPVITTDSGAPAEVVGGGVYGRMFAYGDASSLADAIEADLTDYAGALERAAKARGYASARYSLDAMADAYDRLYRNVAGRR